MDRRSKIEDCVGVLPHNLRSSPLCGRGYEKFFVDFSSIFRSRWIEDRRSKIVWGCCRTIFDPPPCGGGSTKNFSWIFRRFFVACWIEDCGATPPHNLRSSIFDPPATKNLRKIHEKFFVYPPPQGGGSKIVGQHPHTIFDLRSSIHLLRKIYEKSTKNFS